MEPQHINYIKALIKGTENINKRLKKARDDILEEKGINPGVYGCYQKWLNRFPKIQKFKQHILDSKTVLEAQMRFLKLKDVLE